MFGFGGFSLFLPSFHAMNTPRKNKKATNVYKKCRKGLLHFLVLRQYEFQSRGNISPFTSVHSQPTKPISAHYRTAFAVVAGAVRVKRPHPSPIPGRGWMSAHSSALPRVFLSSPAEGCCTLCSSPWPGLSGF